MMQVTSRFAGVCPKVPVAEQKKNNAIRTGKIYLPEKKIFHKISYTIINYFI